MAFFIGAPTFIGIWLRIEAGMVQMHHCAVARLRRAARLGCR